MAERRGQVEHVIASIELDGPQPLGSVRWEGFTHRHMWNMIMDARPDDVFERYERWNRLGAELIEVNAVVQQQLNTLFTTWQGTAAMGAGASNARLLQWSQDVAETTQNIGEQLGTYGNALVEARKRMPQPRAMTNEQDFRAGDGTSGLTGQENAYLWFQLMSDHQATAAEREEARQGAIAVMQTFESDAVQVEREVSSRPYEWTPQAVDRGYGLVAGPEPTPDYDGGILLPQDSTTPAGTTPAGTAPVGVGSGPPGYGGPGGPGGVSGPGGSGPGGGGSGPGGYGPGGGAGSPGYVAPGGGAGGPGRSVPGGVAGPGGAGGPGRYAPGGAGGPGRPVVGGPGGVGGVPGGAGGAGGGNTTRGPNRYLAGGAGGPGGAGRYLPGGAGSPGAAGRYLPGGAGGPGATGGPGGVAGRLGAAGVGGSAGAAGAGRGGGAGMYPPMGGHADGDEDTEKRMPAYLVDSDDLFDDDRTVAPPVFGA